LYALRRSIGTLLGARTTRQAMHAVSDDLGKALCDSKTRGFLSAVHAID
jgi:hypothetical protein